jgi:hypothetical protein
MKIPEQGIPAGAITVDPADRFKLAQAIYNAVTGKTEKLSRAYMQDFLVTGADFEQLHAKCEQASSQWRVLQKNSNVTVHHLDDNKEVFSSFERFKIYDSSRTSATESVVYEFHLLLELPGAEKPQPYKVTLRALSGVSLVCRMEKEMAPPPFLRMFRGASIVVEIEYVDYVVARNLLSMVDSWVNEVERPSRLSWVKHVQRFTHWIPSVAHFAIILLTGVSVFAATSSVLELNAPPDKLAKWLILAGTAVILSSLVARHLGHLIESGIDEVLTLSAIRLNKGDERLIAGYRSRNIWKLTQATTSTVLVALQGLGVDMLTTYLGNLLKK